MIALPVTLRHVGVSAGWCSVRHPHVGHHSRPLTRPLGPQHARNHLVGMVVAGQAVSVGYCSGYADGLNVALHACQVCRGRASRVGHLAVYTVGLHQKFTVGKSKIQSICQNIFDKSKMNKFVCILL